MISKRIMMLMLFLGASLSMALAQGPERPDMARAKGKKLTVKEWKTTPDGTMRRTGSIF